MKTDTSASNEMTIDDGDNLVSDAWSTMVQNSPALRRALNEQGDRWLIENGARIGESRPALV